MRMIDQQRSKLAEGLHAIKAALPTDKIDHLLLRMPWQREKSWLEGQSTLLLAGPRKCAYCARTIVVYMSFSSFRRVSCAGSLRTFRMLRARVQHFNH